MVFVSAIQGGLRREMSISDKFAPNEAQSSSKRRVWRIKCHG
jgi:hypothetical protein